MRAAAVMCGILTSMFGCSPGGSDLDNCRSFAVQWDGVSPAFTPLVVNDSTGEVTYTQPGAGGVSRYASIDDFIAEGQTFGRITRTSWSAQNLEMRTFSYDGSGRLSEISRETTSAGPVGFETATWTDFDGDDRPTAGTHVSSWQDTGSTTPEDACTGSAVTVTYDEDARTVTSVVDYSGMLDGGGACVDTPFINILGRVEVEYYDAQNNWLRVELWQGFQEPTGEAQQTLSVGQPTASDTVCGD